MEDTYIILASLYALCVCDKFFYFLKVLFCSQKKIFIFIFIL